jgi:phage terminase large subunit-like protein
VKQIKVYAIEDPITHELDLKGTPAWVEFYSLEKLHARFEIMRLDGGLRMVMKEYFHQYSTEGTIFKEAFVKDNYIDIEDYSHYELIVTYNDPSFKDTKKNDFKAIVALGKLGSEFHFLECWVQQDTTPAMVTAHYQIYDRLQNLGAVRSVHYMEANFLQSLHLDEYQKHGELLGWHLPIRPDTRAKPDKTGRIENLTAFQGRIKFNRALQKNNSFQNFFEQLMNFPRGHDDAPDALEGAIFILNELGRTKQKADFGGERRVNDW